MLLLFLISFIASVIGAICGIGGGVIIKPTLDLVGFSSADVINFLSGMTVMSMALYNVIHSFFEKKKMDLSIALPLSLGAALGGMLGSSIFNGMLLGTTTPSNISFVQSVILAIICLFTIVYTYHVDKIETKHNSSIVVSLFIGLILGILSSFLGIGGGPFNLLVLSYFYSLDTKNAAIYSLFIILISQLFSLIFNGVNGSIPAFEAEWLIVMVLGGITGGILGHMIQNKMDNKTVDKLFMGFLFIIICVCVMNAVRFGFN